MCVLWMPGRGCPKVKRSGNGKWTVMAQRTEGHEAELAERVERLTRQIERLVALHDERRARLEQRRCEYEALIREAIAQLEQTRQQFKSRQLQQLRLRLEEALAE